MTGFPFTLEEIRRPKHPTDDADDKLRFRIWIDDKDDYAEIHVSRYSSYEGVLSWLRWLKEFQYLRRVKKWSEKPNVAHSSIKLLLKGEVLEHYMGNVPTTTEDNPLTNDMIDAALFEVTKSFFYGLQPRSSLKHFLGTITKPSHMGVTEFYLAFKEVLSFLPYVTPKTESMSSAHSDYTEEELYFLFARSLPEQWKSEFESTGKKETIDELVRFCQAMEGKETNQKLLKKRGSRMV